MMVTQLVGAQSVEQNPAPAKDAGLPLAAGLPAREKAASDPPVRTPQDWAKRRQQILANMQLVMGPLPDARSRVSPELRIDGEEDLGPIVRKRISLAVARDERIRGYLLMPRNLTGKVPGILVPHQTIGPQGSKEPAGLAGLDNQAIAKHLAERGFVCLTIDYPGFGEYRPFDLKKTGFASGIMKAISNNMHAVDALQELP
jgi:hypothetical protein